MASSTISNLLSLFTPPKPKPPPSHLSLSSYSLRNKHKLPPTFASTNDNQYVNTMLSDSGGYNVQIAVEEDEPEESVLNRFRREVMRAGVIQECKRRRYFENKQEEKKRRTRDAARRNRRRRTPFRSQEDQVETSEGKEQQEDDDDDDNWELPEGGLPF